MRPVVVLLAALAFLSAVSASRLLNRVDLSARYARPGSIGDIHSQPRPAHHCYQEPVQGPCRADFSRYAFRPHRKTCEEFVYGGCLGNGNNFETMEDCLSSCR
ncbi:proteinase inhibitor-like [Oratosquilla oratoria]|uniref:proteinase inhibitor-like n=1 Tax=Oratosquilla oratoria TaxID=337810 RepID=UPI003F76B95A